MTTQHIYQLLKIRYQAPEWILLAEVADGIGGNNTRRFADALAFNLFPSRGQELHGIEIKANRSDWLRELKNAKKSAPIQRFCHRWWIAAPSGTVEVSELPPTWGLLEPRATSLRATVKAPLLMPADLTRSFLLSVLRRVSQSHIPIHEINPRLQEHFRAGEAAARRDLNRNIEQSNRISNAVKRFNAAYGGNLLYSDPERVGRAARRAENLDPPSLLIPIHAAQKALDRAEKHLQDLQASTEPSAPKPNP